MGPNANPNQQPVNPNAQPVSPEQAQASGVEVAPEVAPAAPQGTPVQQPAAMPQIPNVPGQQAAQDAVAAQTAPIAPAPQSAPAVAGDVDVIEKEWVDQANKIVDQTKDDPYTEEEAVEALQQDYLKKRYDHDVKKPDQAG